MILYLCMHEERRVEKGTEMAGGILQASSSNPCIQEALWVRFWPLWQEDSWSLSHGSGTTRALVDMRVARARPGNPLGGFLWTFRTGARLIFPQSAADAAEPLSRESSRGLGQASCKQEGQISHEIRRVFTLFEHIGYFQGVLQTLQCDLLLQKDQGKPPFMSFCLEYSWPLHVLTSCVGGCF